MTSRRPPLPDDSSPPALARKIERLIAAGEYRPGDRVGTSVLAERFGTSRGPVREAIRLLESRHLLRVEPNRGAFVREIDDAEVVETLAIRGLLYAYLAEQAAQLGSDEQLARIADGLTALIALHKQRDVTPQAFQRALYVIVTEIFHAAGSPRVSQLIGDLTEGVGLAFGPLSMATRDMRAAEVRSYRALVAAICARQPQKAFASARELHERGLERARELRAFTNR